jgi:poly(hydroxyalkanoate) depolymerase family esterase
MTNHFAFGMTKATELTKAGKLAEATALIQSLLNDDGATAPAASDDAVIEGSFTRLDDASPADAEKPQPAPLQTKPQRNRPSLRGTLRKIAAGGMPDHTRNARGPAPLPPGAEFITLTHRNKRDQRDYKLYIPTTRPSSPMPLIVMLHGCTQSPDDFAAGTGMNALAEVHGFLVAYPAQPTGANANKCWNWFKSEDQARDRGEPALIAGLTRDILRDHPVDPARVYVAGLSAGGAAAAIVAAAYPDLFSAAGVHSGLPVGAANDIPQAFSAMRTGARGTPLVRAVPTIVIHGLADGTVHPRNGKAVVAQTLQAFDGLKATTRKGVSAGGRSFRQTRHANSAGQSMVEHWEIDGAGHAWAGGQPEGSFTDQAGPAASEEMLRFFLQHAQA